MRNLSTMICLVLFWILTPIAPAQDSKPNDTDVLPRLLQQLDDLEREIKAFQMLQVTKSRTVRKSINRHDILMCIIYLLIDPHKHTQNLIAQPQDEKTKDEVSKRHKELIYLAQQLGELREKERNIRAHTVDTMSSSIDDGLDFYSSAKEYLARLQHIPEEQKRIEELKATLIVQQKKITELNAARQLLQNKLEKDRKQLAQTKEKLSQTRKILHTRRTSAYSLDKADMSLRQIPGIALVGEVIDRASDGEVLMYFWSVRGDVRLAEGDCGYLYHKFEKIGTIVIVEVFDKYALGKVVSKQPVELEDRGYFRIVDLNRR